MMTAYPWARRSSTSEKTTSYDAPPAGGGDDLLDLEADLGPLAHQADLQTELGVAVDEHAVVAIGDGEDEDPPLARDAYRRMPLGFRARVRRVVSAR